MPEIDIKMSAHGPIFSGGAPAAAAQIAHRVVDELVDEGEKSVTAQLYVGHGLRTGHYRRSIHGDMLSSLHGRVHDSRVIYGPWLEGVSRRNQSTRFKGYAMFRNTRQIIERMKIKTIERHVRRFLDQVR